MCVCVCVRVYECMRLCDVCMHRRPRERVEERMKLLIGLDGHVCMCMRACAHTELLIDLDGRPERAQDPIAETSASRTTTSSKYGDDAVGACPRIGQKAAAQLCKDGRLAIVNASVDEQMGGRHPRGSCEQGVEARSPRIPV